MEKSRPRVAFVTTLDTAMLHDDFDHPFHVNAFAAAGIDLVHAAWEDPLVRWDSFDLVVVRSPWNYVDRLAEFREWLHARRPLATLHNPIELIEWNLDKAYLAELAESGLSVIPTIYASSDAELTSALAAVDAPQIVVKPSISAGSRLTGRFSRGSFGAEQLGSRILDAGFTVMVQPFASSVDRVGEIGAVFFDGVMSHSFRKGPLLDEEGTLVGGEYREEISAAKLIEDERSLVHDVNHEVERIARSRGWIGSQQHLLYARYDFVTLDDGSVALLEAELFEPSLFLMVDDASAGRFVRALESLLRKKDSGVGN
ncbi:MAG: hypothetical protein WCJ88_01585 [Actinomycetes bacterium]